jgi:hypothetical protein
MNIPLNTHVEKHVLDIDNMMKKFLVEDVSHLLDMFEVAMHYLPKELERLHQAVEDHDYAVIKDSVHSLRGALSYISAPDCNRLVSLWDERLYEEQPSREAISGMLLDIKTALALLFDAIRHVMAQIKDTAK